VGAQVSRGARPLKTVRIDEIEPIRIVDGKIAWRPVRRTLGVRAFGVNAYTADAGDEVVETHDETGSGAGHHEELYIVVTGHATFTVDGETVDAPAGTLVFLDDPTEKRGALATEDGTTVLAAGGARGHAFEVSPWEHYFAAIPAWERGDWDEAERLHREGLARHPDNPSLLYNLACIKAQRGDFDEAIDLLKRAFDGDSKLLNVAREDPDLDPIRQEPRFSGVLERPPA
jgi:tetratricopeptide (TPR) repeat protein